MLQAGQTAAGVSHQSQASLKADFDDTQKLAFSNVSQLQSAFHEPRLPKRADVLFVLGRLERQLQQLSGFGD